MECPALAARFSIDLYTCTSFYPFNMSQMLRLASTERDMNIIDHYTGIYIAVFLIKYYTYSSLYNLLQAYNLPFVNIKYYTI